MIVRAERITKTFGPTLALSNVSINLHSGEVHAIVGENGAGKTTLFKVLSGYEKKDSGSVFLNERPFEPVSAEDAKGSGVVLVMQELTINSSLGIAENVFIDRLRDFASSLGLIKKKKLYEAAQSVLDQIGGSLSVYDNLSSLDLGQLKILEVARALSYAPKVILLDESTAFLNTSEITGLFDVINKLREKGLIVGFVSHHLDEVEKVADRVTILKDGAFVGEYDAKDISRKEMESLMVGRQMLFDFSDWKGYASDKVVLSVKDASFDGVQQTNRISFDLHEREILGIGGLQGSGGQAILEGVVGEKRLTRGTIKLFGALYKPSSPHDGWRAGVGYLPGNRTGEGLVADFSIQENIIMTEYPRKGPFLDVRRARTSAEEYAGALRIKSNSVLTLCKSLSGGNMQKALLAKCLFPKPKVLLLNNPTRGVDIGSRMEIYQKIRDMVRDEGLSVIILSEDLIELLGLADRILVMNRGSIRREISRSEQPEESDIIAYMT